MNRKENEFQGENLTKVVCAGCGNECEGPLFRFRIDQRTAASAIASGDLAGWLHFQLAIPD
jgi:hypothetical protein